MPAIVNWPGKIPKGIVRDQAVTIMDWYPSLLAWCGLEAPGVELDGRSLQPVIASAEAPSAHPVIHYQWRTSWAVRRGDWKLLGRKERQPESRTSYSLHNLADEPPEARDYADEKPGLVAELAELHQQWAGEVSGGRDDK